MNAASLWTRIGNFSFEDKIVQTNEIKTVINLIDQPAKLWYSEETLKTTERNQFWWVEGKFLPHSAKNFEGSLNAFFWIRQEEWNFSHI